MRREAIALIGAAAIAALAFEPLSSAASLKTTLALAVGLVGVLLVMPSLWRRGSGHPTALVAWSLLTGWSLATLVWAGPASPSRPLLWLAGAGFGWTLVAFDAHERRRIVGGLASVVVLGSAAIAWLQLARGARGLGVHGGQGNPNWLGLLLAVGLPLVVDRLMHERGRARGLAALALVLGGATLVIARSYVAWIAVALVALVYLRHAWRLAAVGASVAALSLSAHLADALSGRLWIWRTSLDAAAHALVLGRGQGSFARAFLDAQGPRLAELSTDAAALHFLNATSAHNDWLQQLTEGGAIGVALLALVVVLAAVTLRRRFAAGAASVVALACCALGDSPLEQPAVVLLLCGVLATTPALPRRIAAERSLLALTGLALALALPLAGVEWLSSRWLSQADGAAPHERLELAARAARLAPRSGSAALTHGLALLETGEATAAIAELERAHRLLANVAVEVALGNAHLRSGAAEAAVRDYRRALAWHPASFRARTNLAEALRQLGRLDEAEGELARARDLLPNDPKLLRLTERIRRDRWRAP